MTRVPPDRIDDLVRHLAAEADLRGNADGVATAEELEALVAGIEGNHPFEGDRVVTREDVRAAIHRLLATSNEHAVDTLDGSLRALPPELRRLALEVDGLWGDGYYTVSVDEMDRVASFYLAALPFFIDDASALLELADHLDLTAAAAPGHGQNIVTLRAALAGVDESDRADHRAVRRIFDDAVADANIPGAPALIRDSAFHNPEYHTFSIMRHTAFAVAAVRDLANAVGVNWKDDGAVMLLHDIGKILTRHCVEWEGKPCYSYRDHADVGAEWLKHHRADPELVFFVSNHELRKQSVDELLAVAGNDPSRLAKLVLVAVADQIAKGTEPDQLNSFREQEPRYRRLAERVGLDFNAMLDARRDFIREQYGVTLD